MQVHRRFCDMMKRIFLFAFAAGMLNLAANAQVIQQTPKGAQYQIFTNNPGPKIKQDDIVTFQVVQKTEKDSVLFSTYAAGHPVQIKVQASQNVADLMDVFPALTSKDSVRVKVPVDSVFKGHETERPKFLSARSYIIFDLKIEKVQSLNEAIAERNASITKMQQNETVMANKYIADNNLAVKTTASGLKYMITSPSAGRKVIAGDTILVNYVGKTLNGKVFDTSLQPEAAAAHLVQPGRNYEPIKVIVGQGQVIAGWDEGLQLLNEGAKATFIIPSNLAYGQQGAGQDIGPFSTLVFDVGVVKVSVGVHKTAPAAAAAKAPAKKGIVKRTGTAKKVIKK